MLAILLDKMLLFWSGVTMMIHNERKWLGLYALDFVFLECPGCKNNKEVPVIQKKEIKNKNINEMKMAGQTDGGKFSDLFILNLVLFGRVYRFHGDTNYNDIFYS